jgi:hypothetical protein
MNVGAWTAVLLSSKRLDMPFANMLGRNEKRKGVACEQAPSATQPTDKDAAAHQPNPLEALHVSISFLIQLRKLELDC